MSSIRWTVWIAFSIAAPALLGQEAHLSGTVTDPTGAVAPNVAITVTQTLQSISFAGKSDSDGQFLFPRLPVGPYEIRAEAAGFKTYIQSSINLTTNADVRVNIVMQVGSLSEQVSVSAEVSPRRVQRAPRSSSSSTTAGLSIFRSMEGT